MTSLFPVYEGGFEPEPLSQPPRLFPVEPVGVGTEDVESLTSYLIRLANEHWNSPTHLYKEILAWHQGLKVANKKDCRLDAFTDSAKRFAVALSELSPLDFNFERLTFLPWGRTFATRSGNSFTKKKRWCSFCFDEMRLQYSVIYDKLIWSIEQASVCIVHDVPLSECCPTCQHEQMYLTCNAVPGYCRHCGHALFDLENSKEDFDAPPQEARWKSEACIDLLRFSQNDNAMSISTFRKNIKALIDSEFAGSYRRVARELNLPQDFVRGWLRRGAQPGLPATLDLAYRLDHLPSFFFSQNAQLDISRRRVKPKKPYKHQPYQSDEQIDRIRSDLLTMLARNDELQSTEAVAYELEVSRSVLMNRLPEECAMVVARVKNRRAREKRERDEARAQRVLRRVKELTRQGIYPSDRKVREGKGILTSDLRMPQVKVVLREAQDQFLKSLGEKGEQLMKEFSDCGRQIPTNEEVMAATRTYDPNRRAT